MGVIGFWVWFITLLVCGAIIWHLKKSQEKVPAWRKKEAKHQKRMEMYQKIVTMEMIFKETNPDYTPSIGKIVALHPRSTQLCLVHEITEGKEEDEFIVVKHVLDGILIEDDMAKGTKVLMHVLGEVPDGAGGIFSLAVAAAVIRPDGHLKETIEAWDEIYAEAKWDDSAKISLDSIGDIVQEKLDTIKNSLH